MAMRWLRWKKNCVLVLTERSTREWACGRPDVLGITCARYMIEVEVKRTIQDFRADSKKRCRTTRHLYPEYSPKLFYYAVPPELVSLETELPAWAGLLSVPERRSWGLEVIRAAPVNQESRKLTVKECLRIAHLMSNEIISAHEHTESIICNWRAGHEPFWGQDFEI